MQILPESKGGIFQLLLASGSIAAGTAVYLALCLVLRNQLPFQIYHGILVTSSLAALFWAPVFILSRNEDNPILLSAVAISGLTVAGTIIVEFTIYQLAAYISLPVDLLSFSESPFVDKILRLRLGVSLYAQPSDNVSYPYTPGTEILTYLISKGLGHGDSIKFYRAVQLGYVILASIVATSVCDLTAKMNLTGYEYRYRSLWISVWVLFLFLIAMDPRFNLYNYSLHNDGLALLISVSAFWLLVRYSIAPSPLLLIVMALLPTLGFMVKQSLLIWIVIYSVFLLMMEDISRRQFLLFLIGAVTTAAIAIGICYLLWGSDFMWWVFTALGKKHVSIFRDLRNLFDAGIYAIMGLFGGWILVLRRGSKKSLVLWSCWLLLFFSEVYTSGFAFQRNHLGPGILIASCWFFVALVEVWPKAAKEKSRFKFLTQEALAVFSVILLFGALGHIREPGNPIPPDFFRYISEIEKEFDGIDSNKVLMDTGTWIYLREKVLMKDRSAPVSVHMGKNQPEVNRSILADTIERIDAKKYDKILARQLDTEETWYDFQDRGSGVKAAILANYMEIRRIPGVRGIEEWWPKHLVSEILVLVPKPTGASTKTSTRSKEMTKNTHFNLN